MNQARRKMIRKAINILEVGDSVDQALSILEDVLFAEEDAYDSIPENLQSSWRAEESEEAIEALNDAIDLLTELQSMEDVDEKESVERIQEAIGCLEEIY